MNVHDLIYVQLQSSLFRNEPVSQYSEHELSCGKYCVESKKDDLEYGFLKPEYPFKVCTLIIQSSHLIFMLSDFLHSSVFTSENCG